MPARSRNRARARESMRCAPHNIDALCDKEYRQAETRALAPVAKPSVSDAGPVLCLGAEVACKHAGCPKYHNAAMLLAHFKAPRVKGCAIFDVWDPGI